MLKKSYQQEITHLQENTTISHYELGSYAGLSVDFTTQGNKSRS